MSFLLSGFLGGNLTLITVVISINQLVLSRELGAPGELHQRLDEALTYRETVDEVVDDVPPVTPGRFLVKLHETLARDAEALGQASDEIVRPSEQSTVERLAASLQTDAETVMDALEPAEPGVYSVILATLGTNHAKQLHEIDRLRAGLDDSLSTTSDEVLGRLHDTLVYIDVARKYFRTIYIQKELAYVSRLILYVGIPGQLILAAGLLGYHAVSTGTLTPDVMALALPFVLAAGFAPLLVIGVYMPRLAWVAQKNAAVAPFAASDGGEYV
ncbi:hypothetical protein [Halomarina oriensis]|uniref:Uncharacterized protein n=1 Tax=Halomarina oriensis TaxID=671145 RepID=A0A6B0GG26_9EURY|nr:hypothetical protein [Halomarina oriensis]MWG33772.1 hypothetical protein [Halomarina oriensis]